MRRFALSLILVFNSFALAACSGYETAAIPTNPDSEAPADSNAPVLEEGVRVRVYLRTGEVHEGEVMAVSDETVVLGNPSNHGFVEQAYAFSDIEKCEVEASNTAGNLAGVGLVLVIVVFGVGVYGMRDWGKGFN